jgi:hypothetical protein
MSLPILTTAEDIDTIISYLRTKPTGATLAEARAVVKEAMDPRKVAAFVFWGLITKDEGRLKLAPLGWAYARKTKSAQQVLREILDSVVPYRSALEWAYHQKLSSVTNSDVAAHWHEHHSASLGSENENTIKDQAVCFFRIAEAAGLGKMTIGRRGAPTRLEIDAKSLAAYIEAGPSAPPLAESLNEDSADEDSTGTEDESSDAPAAPDEAKAKPSGGGLRVFITHGRNLELVEQVEAMLELAEIESEIAIKEESTAIPVPEKVFGAMRRCTAGVIIVSREQVQGNDTAVQINANVLIEIGAAFVLYDRRVILLWEKGMPVPSNLQGLYRCEFEGKELGWGSGMKLMKALKAFRT